MLREMKFAYKIFATNLGFSNPYQLNFAITYKCNSRCKFCSIWKIRSKNELTLEEIEKIAKKARFVQWLRLTGGEPFLRRDYSEILKAFYENSSGLCLVSTPTNAIASELSYKTIKKVLDFFDGKYIVSISLDGDEATHDTLRGIRGNWRNAVNLYKRLFRLKEKYNDFSVVFGYTIYPENVGLFENAYKAIKKELKEKVTINNFNFNLFEISDFYYHNLGISKTKEYFEAARKEIEKIIKMRKKKISSVDIIQEIYLKLAMRYLKSRRTPIRCNILNLSCFLDPYGNVFPCTIFGENIGNLRENNYDLRKILKSKKVKDIKEKTIRLKCPNCWTPCEAHQLIVSNILKLI
ncbi:MAG: radical SAM protein [Candidatus Aenigmarchaeota archaeon]|nr:radical SAM protein [Candidatus Aenigmarchaeota archaeon]